MDPLTAKLKLMELACNAAGPLQASTQTAVQNWVNLVEDSYHFLLAAYNSDGANDEFKLPNGGAKVAPDLPHPKPAPTVAPTPATPTP